MLRRSVRSCADAARAATYAKTLAITVVGVPDGVTLSDFPLLVRLSESIEGFSYDDFLGSGGADLHFEDSDGNALAFDVDTWNPEGESIVWVKVPSLEKGDVITSRYGSAEPDANDATAVWSKYVVVYHGNDLSCATGENYPAKPLVRNVDGGFAVSDAETAFLGKSFYNTTKTNGTKIKLGTTANNPCANGECATATTATAAATIRSTSSAWRTSSSTRPTTSCSTATSTSAPTTATT